MNSNPFVYRVALMGCPSRPDVAWNRENLKSLRDLGFNTMQLNIAWGARPGDEPLNLEDVVTATTDLVKKYNRNVEPRSNPDPHAIATRRKNLTERIALCQEMGMRTLFHFGAPFNAQYGGAIDMNGPQPACLSDPATTEYYEALFTAFYKEYPGVTDILVYTYDQDAWCCNEFGTCEACRGIPLSKRLAPFINRLVATWHKLSPKGYLWWSPWELSGGQVYETVEMLDAEGLGLDLHPNIAETQVTLPVDRWLKNTCALALHRNIPTLVESFLGAASEELEPFQYLQHPLTSFRQVRAISTVPGVTGLKEYFGIIPCKEDPNLIGSALAMNSTSLSEQDAVRKIAERYGEAADSLIRFWELTSEAQELYPWDTSWFMRGMGKSDTSHATSLAFLRGQMCDTPAWCSTRHAILMKVDSIQPHPWMMEDVQVRCALAVDRLHTAATLGKQILEKIPAKLQVTFRKCIEETEDFACRAMSYVYHLRESNLISILRTCKAEGKPFPPRIIEELSSLFRDDLAMQKEVRARYPHFLEGVQWIWKAGKSTLQNQPWPTQIISKTFEIPAGFEVEKAWMVASSSERALRMRINGETPEEFGTGAVPYAIDLKPWLVKGTNRLELIALKAGSDYLTAGVCARVEIVSKSGSRLSFESDGSWVTEGAEIEIRGVWGDWPWSHQGAGDGGVALAEAMALFESDVNRFLETCYLESPDQASKGHFSITSR